LYQTKYIIIVLQCIKKTSFYSKIHKYFLRAIIQFISEFYNQPHAKWLDLCEISKDAARAFIQNIRYPEPPILRQHQKDTICNTRSRNFYAKSTRSVNQNSRGGLLPVRCRECYDLQQTENRKTNAQYTQYRQQKWYLEQMLQIPILY
jgi:hypothetical protein